MMRAGGLLIALALVGAASSAEASIIITPGNNPQPGEVNVIFTDQSATTPIVGNVGAGTNDFAVTGTTVLAGNQLSSVSNVITGSGSNLQSVTLTPLGGTLDLLIFNLLNGTGNLELSITDNLGGQFTLNQSLGNGNNFFTITTASGESIAAVTLSTTGSFEALNNIRAMPNTSSALPEPGTWAIMLLGFGVIGLALRRRDTSANLHAA